MARREVIEITCDRCTRTETQDKDSGNIPSPELQVTFHGASFSYEDLCKRCRAAVAGYFGQMTKQKKEEETQSPEAPKVPEAPKKDGIVTSIRKGLGG